MEFETDNCALILIDVHQLDAKRLTPIYNEAKLMYNIKTLLSMAYEHNLLVVNAQHYYRKLQTSLSGNNQSLPKPIIKDNQMTVYKEFTSAFSGTELKAELDKRNIGRLIIAGIVTQGCVKSTCMEAKKLGYEVALVEDCHSNYNENAEEVIDDWNSRLSKEGIKLVKTEEILFT